MAPRAEAPLVLVVGPTGVGKTELAVALAGGTGEGGVVGEVIGADSRQIYRGMDVGTAKPTAAERAAVPHHLIDVADPGEPFDAAAFQAQALAAIADVRRRGRVPFVVGGSGFYVDCLVRGLPDLPPPDAGLRAEIATRIEREGPLAVHGELRRVDPVTAARVHPNDAVRVIRALEVHRQTGRPLSDFPRRPAELGPVERWVVDRAPGELAERVEVRARAMWEGGWPEEVRALLERGVDPEGLAMAALGYREVVEHLEGQTSREEALERIVQRTRLFVRKQRTWFRPGPGETPWHPGRDRDALRERLAERVERARAGAP